MTNTGLAIKSTVALGLALVTSLATAAERGGPFDRICDFSEAVVRRANASESFKAVLIGEIAKLREADQCHGWWLPATQDEISVKNLLANAISSSQIPLAHDRQFTNELVTALATGSLTRLQLIGVETGLVVRGEFVSRSAIGDRIAEELARHCSDCSPGEKSELGALVFEGMPESIGEWSSPEFFGLARKIERWSERTHPYLKVHALPAIYWSVFKFAAELDPTNPWVKRGSWCKRSLQVWEYTPLVYLGDECKPDAVKIKDLFDHERLQSSK